MTTISMRLLEMRAVQTIHGAQPIGMTTIRCLSVRGKFDALERRMSHIAPIIARSKVVRTRSERRSVSHARLLSAHVQVLRDMSEGEIKVLSRQTHRIPQRQLDALICDKCCASVRAHHAKRTHVAAPSRFTTRDRFLRVPSQFSRLMRYRICCYNEKSWLWAGKFLANDCCSLIP